MEADGEPDILDQPATADGGADEWHFDLTVGLEPASKRPRIEMDDSVEIEVGRRAELEESSFIDNFDLPQDDSFMQNSANVEGPAPDGDRPMAELAGDDFQAFDFNER